MSHRILPHQDYTLSLLRLLPPPLSFIEGDFEAYVKTIAKHHIWGGEPELLMASHVLKTKISVFMLDRSTDKLLKISTHGKEARAQSVMQFSCRFLCRLF
ncbi:hypothetical protein L2E82_20298 [Cichorium intybus]|uniref:Uncharacterized protein n=1 Tax=Cichorium intybus TaxID=13427 RepID=A0ACB9DTR0_CICIN|nr:hypothetical protein L2E82_20298 [Cichorium intybus]